MSIVFK